MLYCFKPSDLKYYTMYLQHFYNTDIVYTILHGRAQGISPHAHKPDRKLRVVFAHYRLLCKTSVKC